LSRATLLEGGSAVLDAWVLHNHVHWRAISNLERVLTSDGDRDLHHHLDSAEEWALYQRAMLQTAHPAAVPVAGLIPEPTGRGLLLDLGGAHGLYGAAICRRFPPMRSRVIDLPDAIAHARALGEQAGIADVVEYEQGDLRTSDLGDEISDVVFMGNIVHHFSDEALQAMLRNVHRALEPGGVIAIWDMAPPPDLPEMDLVAEGFSMLFYLTSASECRGPDVYRSVLTACGFGQIDVQFGPSPTHILITGRR
jgi:SAM-dependent methyltransferase